MPLAVFPLTAQTGRMIKLSSASGREGRLASGRKEQLSLRQKAAWLPLGKRIQESLNPDCDYLREAGGGDACWRLELNSCHCWELILGLCFGTYWEAWSRGRGMAAAIVNLQDFACWRN